jgi:hypothetical protein
MKQRKLPYLAGVHTTTIKVQSLTHKMNGALFL